MKEPNQIQYVHGNTLWIWHAVTASLKPDVFPFPYIHRVFQKEVYNFSGAQRITEVVQKPSKCHTIMEHIKFWACNLITESHHWRALYVTPFQNGDFQRPREACCVFWFEETKSATQVLINLHMQHGKEPPSRHTIYTWHKDFVKICCLVKSEGELHWKSSKVNKMYLMKAEFRTWLYGEFYEIVYISSHKICIV